MKSLLRSSLAGLLLLAALGAARAQWVTETYPLLPGWNAIWLSHDCGHDTLPALLASRPEITKVWRWNPLGSTIQYVTTPANPVRADAEWAVWRRGDESGSTLSSLTGNAGYLVEVEGNVPVTLTLTGRPLLPRFNGQITGVCFTGFPAAPASGSSSDFQRRFERFFQFNDVLRNVSQVFRYPGGPLNSAPPKNPAQIADLANVPVTRGTAYWIAASQYTAYYGPIAVTATDGDGLDFGTNSVARVLRLKNVTNSATPQSVTVTIQPVNSAAPPAGQAALAGPVPMMLRREGLDPVTLQPIYDPFTAPITRTLQPGEETEITVHLNRGSMTLTAKQIYQSVLQVSDSLGLTRVDVPVRAVSTTLAGLWVGQATAATVDQIEGKKAVAGPASGSGFSQRMIVHIDNAGKATLLQQAYLAVDSTDNSLNPAKILTRSVYSQRPQTFTNAARVSSAFFPLDLVAAGTGIAGRTGQVAFEVLLGFNASTNPFVHTYHPAHDNLDAAFTKNLPSGAESYDIRRDITLEFVTANTGITDPAWGSTMIGGNYSEKIRGLRASPTDASDVVLPLNVSGIFILRRVSDIAVLTQIQP